MCASIFVFHGVARAIRTGTVSENQLEPLLKSSEFSGATADRLSELASPTMALGLGVLTLSVLGPTFGVDDIIPVGPTGMSALFSWDLRTFRSLCFLLGLKKVWDSSFPSAVF